MQNVKSWFNNRRAKEKRKSGAFSTPTTTTTSATAVSLDLNDIPPAPDFKLETDVTKLHARIKELEAENRSLKQQLYVKRAFFRTNYFTYLQG